MFGSLEATVSRRWRANSIRVGQDSQEGATGTSLKQTNESSTQNADHLYLVLQFVTELDFSVHDRSVTTWAPKGCATQVGPQSLVILKMLAHLTIRYRRFFSSSFWDVGILAHQICSF